MNKYRESKLKLMLKKDESGNDATPLLKEEISPSLNQTSYNKILSVNGSPIGRNQKNKLGLK